MEKYKPPLKQNLKERISLNLKNLNDSLSIPLLYFYKKFSTRKTPFALFFYTNPRGDLAGLVDERESIEKTFSNWNRKNPNYKIEFQGYSRPDLMTLNNAFNDYKGRIVLFHFSGHSKGELQSYHSQDIHIDRILDGLKENKDVAKLIFLNSCATLEQRAILSKDLNCVFISTSKEVSDTKASMFSSNSQSGFYSGLVNQANIETAFNAAIKAVFPDKGNEEIEREQVYRGLHISTKDKEKEKDWILTHAKESEKDLKDTLKKIIHEYWKNRSQKVIKVFFSSILFLIIGAIFFLLFSVYIAPIKYYNSLELDKKNINQIIGNKKLKDQLDLIKEFTFYGLHKKRLSPSITFFKAIQVDDYETYKEVYNSLLSQKLSDTFHLYESHTYDDWILYNCIGSLRLQLIGKWEEVTNDVDEKDRYKLIFKRDSSFKCEPCPGHYTISKDAKYWQISEDSSLSLLKKDKNLSYKAPVKNRRHNSMKKLESFSWSEYTFKKLNQ